MRVSKQVAKPVFLLTATLAIGCALGAGVSGVLGEKKAGDKPAEPKSDDPSASEQPSPYAAFKAPGERHKLLEPSIGEWEFTQQVWHTPDAEPVKASGTSSRKWVHGGRFVEESYTYTADGEAKDFGIALPYHATIYAGHNNWNSQFQRTLISGADTGMTTLDGTYDEKTRTIEVKGEFKIDAGGQSMTIPVRITIARPSNDEEVMTTYFTWTLPDKTKMEQKAVEVALKRKK